MYTEQYLAPDKHNREMAMEQGKKYIDTNIKTHEQLEELVVQWILHRGWTSSRKCKIDKAL